MNKLGRGVFYGFVLLLWVLLAALSLEGWVRWQWRRMETRNPFVASRVRQELWPIPRIPENDFSAYLTDQEFRNRYRGQGKSLTPLPAPSPEEELAARFPVFLAQEDDFGRAVFSNVYGMNILSLDPDNRVTQCLCSPEYASSGSLETVLPEADRAPAIELLTRATDSPEAQVCIDALSLKQDGRLGYCLLSAEAPAQAGSGIPPRWLVFPRKEVWQPPDADTIWELPFFTYQKHVERKDRINALGITEDFRINNFGFRDADVVMPKPDGAYRILCIGASTTEEGPVNDLTYPGILETLLNRHFGFNRVDVINCGLSGMNSLKHRMRMGDYLALDPDLIVIYNAVNDICHDLFPVWLKDASPLQKRLRESRFFCRYFGHYLLPGPERLLHDIETNKMVNLEFMSRYARNHGVETAVCSFAAPNPEVLSRVEREYYEYYSVLEWTGRYSNFEAYRIALTFYNEALRRLCNREKIHYIPVEENMRDGVIMFGDICHLRNPGIEKKAGIIAEALIPVIEKELNLQTGTDTNQEALS